MRHLVEDDEGAVLALAVGRGVAEEQVVSVDHARDVLHRAPVELGDEDLVVFAVGVGDAEPALEEVAARAGELIDDHEAEMGAASGLSTISPSTLRARRSTVAEAATWWRFTYSSWLRSTWSRS